MRNAAGACPKRIAGAATFQPFLALSRMVPPMLSLLADA
jgi:hypothetical protein